MSTKYYLTKRPNGYYYIGYLEGNRRRWKTTKCTVKTDALAFLKSFECSTQKTDEPLRLGEFREVYKTRVNGSIRKTTLRSYLPSINTFISSIGDKNLADYTVGDVETFKQLRMGKISPASVNIELRSLKSVFNSAIKLELLHENPFRKVSLVKTPQKLPVYLTKEEFRTLFSVVKEPVLRDIYLFAVLSGFRKGEILNLQWSGVDFEKRQVTITNSESFQTKSGKLRTVPMNDAVFEMLKRRVSTSNGCKYVFHRNGFQLDDSYATHRFKDYVVALGLNKELHFHSLRHTAASWLVDAGVSLYAVQNILGHASITTTQMYSHIALSTLHESVNRVSLD